MKTIVCLAVAAVLVNTAIAEEPKEVNIALETVLRFGNKDPSSGLGVIDKVQTALENIKKGIEVRNGRRNNPNDMTFTDFTAEAAKILKDYDDNDLEDVFDVIGEETTRYINREVGFQKWFGSDNVRRHLSDQLATFKELQADTFRQYLDKVIIAAENKKYKGETNDILDIGNFLYIGGSHKLKSAIRNLEKLQRATDVRLDNVIREILIFVFFDHISKLNENTKRELMEVIADYFKINRKQGKKNTRSSTMDSIEAYSYTSKRNNQFPKNKIDVNDDKRNMGEPRSILRTKTVHHNKRYDYQSRIQKDREAVTAFTKLYKLKDNTRILTISEEANALLGSDASHKTPFDSIIDKKISNITRQTNNTKTKTINQSNRSRFSIKYRKITTNAMLLTGGQRKLSIDLRGQSSSSEKTYEHLDNTKEELQSPQDIIDKKHPAKPYLSVERFLAKKEKNISKVNKEEDEQITSTVNDANMSGEGLSIEEFKNDRSIEHGAIRKYNKPATSNITVTKAQDVKTMIKNKEMQREDVKGNYDFRNLTAVTDNMLHKPTFRASLDYKPKSKAKTKHHYPNSESLEKNNQEFFLRDSSERIINETTKKPNSTMRTHDTKAKVSTKVSTLTSNVSKIRQNTTTKAAPRTTITKSSTVKSTITTLHNHKINNVKNTVKNVSQIDNKTQISNITKAGINKNGNASSIKTTTGNTTNNKIVTKGIQDHYTFNPLLLYPE